MAKIRKENEQFYINTRLKHKDRVAKIKSIQQVRNNKGNSQKAETQRHQDLEDILDQWIQQRVKASPEVKPPKPVPICGQVSIDEDEEACA